MTPILHSPSSGLPYAVGPVETPEIDLQIRTLFDKMGLKWCYGGSYLTQTYWNAYKHLAAYCPTKGEYSYLDFYKGHPDRYTLISATDFMALNTESGPKRGDWVMVGNSEPPTKKRIFLMEIEGAERPYACVIDCSETKFQKGENFTTASWKFMAPIVEPEQGEPFLNTASGTPIYDKEKYLFYLHKDGSIVCDKAENIPVGIPVFMDYIEAETYRQTHKVKHFNLVTSDGVKFNTQTEIVYRIFNNKADAITVEYAVANPDQGPFYSRFDLAEAHLNTLIEGYVCPMDLFEGHIKKGAVYVKKPYHGAGPIQTYSPIGFNNNLFNLPSEIVQSWTPKIKKP